MKRLLTTSLLILVVGSASAQEEETLTNIVSNSDALPAEVRAQPTGNSAVDLSLLGVISLGIIGLFWIRRHISEL